MSMNAYFRYRDATGREWFERVPLSPAVGRAVWLACWRRDRESQGCYGFRRVGKRWWQERAELRTRGGQ